MKRQTPANKLRTAIKTAIGGALLFGVFTAFVPIGDHYFGSGIAGQFWPETFWGLEWIIGLPGAALLEATGIDHSFVGQFLENIYFAIFINALIGALLAFVIASIWHLFMMAALENEPTAAEN